MAVGVKVIIFMLSVTNFPSFIFEGDKNQN